jgi:hypothetical protein
MWSNCCALRVSLPRIAVPGCGAKPATRGVHISTALDFLHGQIPRAFPSFCQITRAAAMNFVDVQPKSFLDYAWTSPSPTAMNNAVKPSKTSRKQNRCCDQCRKGKRACDAAILEDTLLETSKSGGNPTVFHYSGELHFRRG